MLEYRLFYEEDGTAYFTDGDLDNVVADDWNDVRRQATIHKVEDADILKAKIDGPIESANFERRPTNINKGRMAWMKTVPFTEEPAEIRALMTLRETIELVQRAGGEVYLPASSVSDYDHE